MMTLEEHENYVHVKCNSSFEKRNSSDTKHIDNVDDNYY